MKQSVAVKLAGQTLNLRTEDDPKYVRALVDHLEERLDEIRLGAGSASAHEVALLAGLRIVDELFRSQRHLSDLQGMVQTRVGRALSLLDEQDS